ncbi:MAG: hypothetical protein ACLQVD_01115 [Capsulimonadaceae bacterium]
MKQGQGCLESATLGATGGDGRPAPFSIVGKWETDTASVGEAPFLTFAFQADGTYTQAMHITFITSAMHTNNVGHYSVTDTTLTITTDLVSSGYDESTIPEVRSRDPQFVPSADRTVNKAISTTFHYTMKDGDTLTLRPIDGTPAYILKRAMLATNPV